MPDIFKEKQRAWRGHMLKMEQPQKKNDVVQFRILGGAGQW